MDEGHCGLPTAEMIPLAEKLLEVPQPLIVTALDLELHEGNVIADRAGETPCVFLAGLYRAERVIAERLMRLANGTLPWPWIDPDKALPWVEKRIALALAESQIAAIRLALTSKVLVMTGGPGVGKTTIVRAILRILAAKGVKLLLCAPTGRAAKRMTEATGFEAKTIHRLLEVDPKGGGFKRGEDNPLDCDLLVVDEASMVDVMLMQALTKAVLEKAALLIVGDIDQLPSVGPGQVLADVISSGAVPVVRLTEVFRQAAQSRIITSAHRINQGSIPDLNPPGPDSDFYFVQADDPETAVSRIIELVKTRIPKRFGLDPIRDIQVLCPMNRGGVGARSLNIELQAALNPAGDRKVERFGWTFAPGDKVMQIENDYDKEVYNGDIGTIDDVDPAKGELTATFDGRTVTYGFGELDMLVPAYAATIHKSQGSEYPAVVIRKKQLRRIGWRILQGAIDHAHHVVVELLRGPKDFTDGRKRFVGDGLILGLVGLDLGPDQIAHSGQHVAITRDIGPGGERAMSRHVFGLVVGDREVVVDRVDDAVDAATIGIIDGRIARAETRRIAHRQHIGIREENPRIGIGMGAVGMSDNRGAAGHLQHRSVVGIVGLGWDRFFCYRRSLLAREAIGRAMLETKREIAVGDDGGLVLGRELAIAAGMIAVEMGIDDVFDRLAAARSIDGRLDLIV
jgi:hypothetical protein